MTSKNKTLTSQIEYNSKTYLALHTGISRTEKTLTKMSKELQGTCFLVSNESLHHVASPGFISIDDEVLFLIDHQLMRSADELIQQKKLSFQQVQNILKAYALAKDTEGHELPLDPEGILLSKTDDSILFVPQSVLDIMHSNRKKNEAFSSAQLLNYQNSESYFFGALLYFALTGNFHCPFENIDKSNFYKSRGFFNPLISEDESLSDFLSTINRLLSASKKSPLALNELIEKTNKITIDPTVITIQQKSSARYAKAFKAFLFLKKNSTVLIVVAVSLTIVLSVGGSILRNVMAPRKTTDMTAIEVVQSYYDGITTFDHELLEDCLADGVGKIEIDTATQLYVISRMRLAVEQQQSYVNPQRWIEQGEPTLPAGIYLYGIGNLEIETIAENKDNAAFRTRYTRWSVASNSDNSELDNQVRNFSTDYTDLLSLEFDGRYWSITSLKSEEQ